GSVPALTIAAIGAEESKPAPGVLEAIEAADVVLFPPSNPVVSIGTILAVPGIRDAVATRTVVGVSPIIRDAPVRGMADACLTAIGSETSARAVAELYGPGLLDGWLVDDADAEVRVPGVEVRPRPLLMTDEEATAAIARAALDLALELKRAEESKRAEENGGGSRFSGSRGSRRSRRAATSQRATRGTRRATASPAA